MSAYIAEFMGTLILVLLGDGVCANNVLAHSKFRNSGGLFVLIGWCLAVGVPAGMFAHVSGAHFNPVFTFGLAVAGLFPWDHVIGYMIAQMFGGFVGAMLVWLFYYPHFQNSPDVPPQDKLGIFCTTPGIRSIPFNLFSEIIATMFLLFGMLGIATAQPVSGVGTLFVAAIILVIGTGLGGTTGFAMNPARDLSPRLVHAIVPIQGKGSSDWSYSWVPVIGPLIGGVVGALLYVAVY
jgi:glycerol uptake facilitator protein